MRLSRQALKELGYKKKWSNMAKSQWSNAWRLLRSSGCPRVFCCLLLKEFFHITLHHKQQFQQGLPEGAWCEVFEAKARQHTSKNGFLLGQIFPRAAVSRHPAFVLVSWGGLYWAWREGDTPDQRLNQRLLMVINLNEDGLMSSDLCTK